MVRFYNWWNLQSSPSVTSLNTANANIYAGMPSASYFASRGSLNSSCGFWSRIRLKRMFFYRLHITKYCIFKELQKRVTLRSVKILVLMWYSANTYYVTVTFYCKRVCVCVCAKWVMWLALPDALLYKITRQKDHRYRCVLRYGVFCLRNCTCYVSLFLSFTWNRKMKDSVSCIICNRQILR